MAEVDYERVVLRLKEFAVSKTSFGREALLTKLAELEVECEIPEEGVGFDSRPRQLAAPDESHEPADEPSEAAPHGRVMASR